MDQVDAGSRASIEWACKVKLSRALHDLTTLLSTLLLTPCTYT